MISLSGQYLPVGIHRATRREIVEEFVDRFLPDGATAATWTGVVPPTDPRYARLRLYFGWLMWNAALRKILGRDPVMEWIGGSFVSDKVSPNDLDVAVWVDGLDWESRSVRVQANYYDQVVGASAQYGCHASLLVVLTEGHPDYDGYLGAIVEWTGKFSSVRDSTIKRGFLEVAGDDLA